MNMQRPHEPGAISRIAALAIVVLGAAMTVAAGSSGAATGTSIAGEDDEINARIREEGLERSQIMATLHHLTDVYGPRLTGSPNLRQAGEWAIRQMEEWGLTNGRLEPFDFGHPGWLNDRHSVHVVAPVRDTLVAEVLAWTPGTDGPVRAPVVMLAPPSEPLPEELEEFLAARGADVRGRIVMVGEPSRLEIDFEPPRKRRSDEQLQRFVSPSDSGPRQPSRGGPRQGQQRREGAMSSRDIGRAVDAFLVEHGAAARLNDAGRRHGQIRAFSNRTYDREAAVPTLVLRNEDYGRIARLTAGGATVELQIEIVNRWFEEGRTVHNAIAELPGTDLAEQVVMLGAHLDSWHAATGATDNAAGSAIMMEAARIIAALGIEPRRTVRVALWGGEEQGLLGSRAYVAEHFGTFEEPLPDYDRFAGYFNVDSGTGRLRGATVFGPPDAASILADALSPFADLGFVGAAPSRSRRRGGSDHTSFNSAGLPGIGMGQDPIEYGSHTWHTNLDTYERISEEDVKAAAVVVAAGVWHLATRDDPLPRFATDDMPEPPDTPS